MRHRARLAQLPRGASCNVRAQSMGARALLALRVLQGCGEASLRWPPGCLLRVRWSGKAGGVPCGAPGRKMAHLVRHGAPLPQQGMVDRRINHFRCSIVASISACHAEDPGSIPGGGVHAHQAGAPLDAKLFRRECPGFDKHCMLTDATQSARCPALRLGRPLPIAYLVESLRYQGTCCDSMAPWPRGVTASTLDPESSNRGSNPRRTCWQHPGVQFPLLDNPHVIGGMGIAARQVSPI